MNGISTSLFPNFFFHEKAKTNEQPFSLFQYNLISHILSYYLRWSFSNVILLRLLLNAATLYIYLPPEKILLTTWQFKSSAQSWYHFLLQNLISLLLSLSQLVLLYSFTISSYSIIFPGTSLSPTSKNKQVLSIISAYHLLWLSSFQLFYHFCWNNVFIIWGLSIKLCF